MSIETEITRLKNAKQAIKTALEDKGVTVADTATLDGYCEYINDIQIGYPLADYFAMLDGTETTVTIPSGLTELRDYAFYRCENLTTITIPETTMSIGGWAFDSCTSLENVNISSGVTSICTFAFKNCTSLTNVTIPDSVTTIGNFAFNGCTSLATMTISGGITFIGPSVFQGCKALENITIKSGFNANNLNLSVSVLYSAETIVSWLNALADRTGQEAYTLTIGGTNLAKLSAEQIAIATNKNWTLA